MKVGHISRETLWRLKAATRDLLARAGKLERAAEITGLSTSHLSRCQSDSDENAEHFLPIAAVFVLEQDIGRPIVTAALLDATGLVPAAPVGDGGRKPGVWQSHADTLKAVGELSQEVGDALRDRSVTKSEARRIYDAGGEAIERIEAMRRAASAAAVSDAARPDLN